MGEELRSKEIRHELEIGLGSVGRLRILAALGEGGLLTKYMLEKRTGLKAVDVRNNLEKLKEIGWIKEYGYQPRKHEINTENELVSKLLGFLRAVHYI